MRHLRTTTTIIFLVICNLSFAQISYNKSVISSFDKAFSTLDSNVQENTFKILTGTKNNGIAVFTQFKIDTLEFNQLKKTIKIRDIDETNSAANDDISPDTVAIAMVLYKAIGKNLILNLGSAFGNFFTLQIAKGEIEAAYLEENGNSLFWLKPGTKKYKSLYVPAKVIKMTLSNKNAKKGEQVFGEVEIQTDSYFETSAFDKDEISIKKRLLLKFIFRVTN